MSLNIRQINTGFKCPLIGCLKITIDGSLIEVVAIDNKGNVKPDSYGSFQAKSFEEAKSRVQFAFIMYQSHVGHDPQLAAQEAFRSLVGGYDVR
jgi:hypothetical protein